MSAPEYADIDAAPVGDLDGSPFDVDDVFGMLGIDAPPIDDADPFSELSPEWARFARHLMRYFNPDQLPRMVRPFAPAAVVMMAKQLGDDPGNSRKMALELIEVAVRDLRINRDALACWDPNGAPLAPDA